MTAQVTHLSEHMDDKNVNSTQFRVGRGYTVVDEQKRILFIDYDNGFLFNQSKETGLCRGFDLSISREQDGFAVGHIKIFSELKFVVENQHRGETDQVYSLCQVLNAPRAMMLRGVTAARFEQFGIIFTPGVNEYSVNQAHADFKELLEMAQRNAATAGVINPLIPQLDLSQLLSRFRGVPVHKRGKDSVKELLFSIEKKRTLRELLSPQCAGL